MTPPVVDEQFDREYGCTTVEWLRWLPGAVRDCAWHQPATDRALVHLSEGASLGLHWCVLPPRRIALISMPRMAVSFRFANSSAAERLVFMRYFDLFMQRGGG